LISLPTIAPPSASTGSSTCSIRWPAELNITQKENELLISGQAHPSAQDKEYLYRGIAGRDYERRFQLADYVKVMGARLADGMLSIDLKRELPEEKKARAIRIEGADGQRAITQQ
jgi:molecular chaperone IbpA